MGSEDTHQTHRNEKWVQYPAMRVGFHSSALELPTEFGQQGPARLSRIGKGQWVSEARQTEMTTCPVIPLRGKVIIVLGSTEKGTSNKNIHTHIHEC